MKTPKLLIFVPAYNCEVQIRRTLEQIRQSETKAAFDTVLVLDNQSTDNTLNNAISLANTFPVGSSIIVAKNRANLGLGGSHKAAINWALRNKFTHMVVLHGDDQGRLSDFEIQIEEVLDSGSEQHVLGARFMKGSNLFGYSKVRILGNKVFNVLFSIVSGAKIYDLGSGLNIFSLSKLNKLTYMQFADDLTFNIDLLLAIVRGKQSIKFSPISWRETDQISNVRLFSQTITTVKKLIMPLSRNKPIKEVAANHYAFEILYDSNPRH